MGRGGGAVDLVQVGVFVVACSARPVVHEHKRVCKCVGRGGGGRAGGGGCICVRARHMHHQPHHHTGQCKGCDTQRKAHVRGKRRGRGCGGGGWGRGLSTTTGNSTVRQNVVITRGKREEGAFGAPSIHIATGKATHMDRRGWSQAMHDIHACQHGCVRDGEGGGVTGGGGREALTRVTCGP